MSAAFTRGQASATDRDAVLRRYYRLHAPIYDLTRWAFLFGRDQVVRQVAEARGPVLEVGCGTGHNLLALRRLRPDLDLTGVDRSPEMLARARARLPASPKTRWLASDAELAGERFAAVLLSYVLTMCGEDDESVLASAYARVAPGGTLHIVDFHDTPSRLFRRWMQANHVAISGALPGMARRLGGLVGLRRHCAYAGLWRYVVIRVTRPEGGMQRMVAAHQSPADRE